MINSKINKTMFNFTISLILTHFLADWVMQPRWMAQRKSKEPFLCLYHGIITGLFLFLTYGLNSLYGLKINWEIAIIVSIVYLVCHSVQDWLIWRIYGKCMKKEFYEDYWFYSTIAIDQSIHLSLMLWLSTFVIM